MRCCPVGCARRCVRQPTPVPVQRERNECPQIQFNFGCQRAGRPQNSCTEDSLCSNGQKCCSNGCSLRCTPAVALPSKPGQCPPMQVGVTCNRIQLNAAHCSTRGGDSACGPREKCCTVDCSGPRCIDPNPLPRDFVKPGQCPPPPPPGGPVGTCEWKPNVNCNDDVACPGNKKCCSGFGCGPVCVDPVLPQVQNRAQSDDFPLTEESSSFAIEDFSLEQSFAVQDSNSGISSQNQPDDPSKLPAWAIGMIVVFTIIFIGMIAVTVQLILFYKSQ